MGKSPVDVVVIGSHPSCAFAAMLLKQAKVSVLHVETFDSFPDRLVQINPEFFKLHPMIQGLQKSLDATAFHGIRFVGETAAQIADYRQSKPAGCFCAFSDVCLAFAKLLTKQKVKSLAGTVRVGTINEQGMELTIGEDVLHARMAIVGGEVDATLKQSLGISRDRSARHRYAFLKVPGKTSKADTGNLMPMSLELGRQHGWGWMFAGKDEAQIAVAQSGSEAIGPVLEAWISRLQLHGLLKTDPIDRTRAQIIELPLAGALTGECVGNRTLLIGPAGGFYSAAAEDIYPGCWSSLFAAETALKALKEKHLQDALQDYRRQWGSTLGDYLRGPQQNLHFLLPLVYRNRVMCARLAEAILTGSSVVR